MTESTSIESVRVRVVQSAAEFASLADSWEDLQKNATSTSVFQTFDWQRLWWTTYGRGQPLRLLLATEGNRLVGILPLYIQTVPAMRISVRLLRPIGIGGDTSPDDLGPVLAAGCEDRVAQALATAVMQIPDWDVMQLSDMLTDCAFTAAIRSEIGRRGLPFLTGRSERIAYLELPSTWEGWLEKLSRDRRWRIRSLRKKLHAAHPTRFLVWSDPNTLDAAIDRLAFLHNKRWNAVDEVHGFATPEYLGFHRSVMHACLRRDRLRLYCLEVAGQIVAMYYFYQFRNRLYLMQSGFDPDFWKWRPGHVLLGHIIEHAISEGRSVLDFLRGDHRYKEKLATGERETVHVTAFRWTVGALAHRARRIVMPAAKARVMEMLRRLGHSPTKME
jgi:CelD/BcsL family acetyltransferase involved in cellulose biosynthesis